MSRAHVREVDGDEPEDLPELPLSPHPNYVTTRGLQLLEARRDQIEAEIASIPEGASYRCQRRAVPYRELRWLRARIAAAQLVADTPRDPARVAFGAEVTVIDDNGAASRYRIVGEDEADPDAGLISWTSPLARALIGLQVGDVALWRRPAGDRDIEISAITWPT